jgi:hypothetical protein
VCKFFLDALEKGRYGWKWICPNGMQCHYRHCLPAGYVVKKTSTIENRDDVIGLEDMVDELREGLKSGGPKVSKEMFLTWKAERTIRKENEVRAQESDPKKKGTMRTANGMTGRALFQFDPTMFVDDDEAADDAVYADREDPQDDDDDD